MTLDDLRADEARRADEIRPYLAQALLRAERRREMVAQLAQLGMSIAQAVCRRAHEAPDEAGSDRGAKAATEFAAVSRAVRLTLALEEKLDETIIALRKGRWPRDQVRDEDKLKLDTIDVLSRLEISNAAWQDVLDPPGAHLDGAILDIVCEPLDDPKAEKVREEVFEAIEMAHGWESLEGERALMRLHERLVETEAYERFLSAPFGRAVRLICNDLNLAVDWELWDEETGFPRPDDRRWDPDKKTWVFKDEAAAAEPRRALDKHRRREAPAPQPHALE